MSQNHFVESSRPPTNAPLQDHIDWYQSRGLHLDSQTETTAKLSEPKQFAWGWAFFWFIFFGVGVFVYLIYYMLKSGKAVHLTVVDGLVEASGANI